jgi:hypothetical protein
LRLEKNKGAGEPVVAIDKDMLEVLKSYVSQGSKVNKKKSLVYLKINSKKRKRVETRTVQELFSRDIKDTFAKKED